MAPTRGEIRFLRGARAETIAIVPSSPAETVLDYVRLTERKYGTKEGCAEGDCGACTVVVGQVRDGDVHYAPVNSCIQFLGQLEGTHLLTIEDLARDGDLNFVQKAFVDHHASQCGFCTPGFVMSTLALCMKMAGRPVTRKDVLEALAGNLCRCTGYRPIVDAALEAVRASGASDMLAAPPVDALKELDDAADVFVGDEERFFAAPRTVEGLAALYGRHPDATLVAGATDVGLWATKNLSPLPRIIWLGRIEALRCIERRSDGLHIGAAASYADVEPAMAKIDPDLATLWSRIGSVQVRAMGTVGGNIANGSPVGDTPPVLMALGAKLHVCKGDTHRTIPLEDFFLAYGKQDLEPGEFVTGVTIPSIPAQSHFRCFKLSKRFDQDISAVLVGVLATLEGGKISALRIAFGGMAATPKRARKTETALIGKQVSDDALEGIIEKAIAEDFAPIDDARASALYRTRTASALVLKALLEISGASDETTRVTGHRRQALAAAE